MEYFFGGGGGKYEPVVKCRYDCLDPFWGNVYLCVLDNQKYVVYKSIYDITYYWMSSPKMEFWTQNCMVGIKVHNAVQ